MTRSPGRVDAKENPHISSSKMRVECEDSQGKAAGGNADPLGKENRKFSAQLQLVSIITTSTTHIEQGLCKDFE